MLALGHTRVRMRTHASSSGIKVVLGRSLLLCVVELVLDFFRQFNRTALLKMLSERRMRLLQWVRRKLR